MNETHPRHLLYRQLEPAAAERLTRDALSACDDGELYLQHRSTESFGFDDGRMKTADYGIDSGFGLRGVSGEMTGFAHADEISEGAIRRASETLRLLDPATAPPAPPPRRSNRHLYTASDPLSAVPFEDKVALCQKIDAALRQALVNLESVAAPAGEMTVLLGPGWPGILLHEAIGHGLEGDFNRKKTSAFSGRVGTRVAAAGVTVVDDGAIDNRRGSLSIDDEGTPTQENILIEDGILKGYMQDRLNARLMGVAATGNGRRESYGHAPMPRMTNTFMRGGNDDPGELLSRVKSGIFAKSFGGGQVDIVSGKFVFTCTEAYRIENGKLGSPIKGATLIGDGPSVLTKVLGIGNDMALDEGVGMCGKGGQSVPAGVGQPTLLIDGLTVGGTAA